jgi:hypothetical protein
MRATLVTVLAAQIGIMSWSQAARAGDHSRACLWGWWRSCGAACCACPNDYVCKPLPCPPPGSCAAPYCYDAKPIPVPACRVCGCDDTYCSKPLPPWPCACEPWYRCVPTQRGGAVGSESTLAPPEARSDR